MCDDFTENEDVEPEDVALRTIFLECLASSSSSSSSEKSLPTATSNVYVSTLVDYIREKSSGKYRNKVHLDELQNAIEEVSVNGQVNWALFKEASRRWVEKIRRNRWQDGNNNIENHHSKCAMSTDTTPESADETDSGSGICGEVAQVDLRLRVRRFDEENALLREELMRAEELSAGFQRQFENLRRKLDQTNDKCRQLERENDEHKEILHEVEQKERYCRWALQKSEKERDSLSRQLEQAETERQKIAALNSKLETYKKEKLDCVRETIVYRREIEEKQIECEMLREKLTQIADNNKNLQESYEETIRHLREQNQELKNEIIELGLKQSDESLTDRSCLTPPMSHLNCLMQSTPYSNKQNVEQQDSLYAELKASGFSVEETGNDSRIRELEEELSWYNEEIRDAVKQIENVLEKLKSQRRTPHVPDLQLNGSTVVNTADIYELLQKISQLSNAVNEMIWKPKVKDASSQINVDSTVNTERQIYSQYGITSFQDRMLLVNEIRKRERDGIGEANERRESGFFVEAFSMNSRLLGEYVKEVQVATEPDSYRKTDAVSPSRKESMTAPSGIQEHTIIDPIVEELDRILECANKTEAELLAPTQNCSTAKNPKFRGIHTCAQPTTESRISEINYSIKDSPLNSPKHLASEFAETYVVTSGGDAPPLLGMVNNNSLPTGGNLENHSNSMLKIIPRDNSSKCIDDSLSELMSKTEKLDISKLNESDTLPEESLIKNTQDSIGSHENLASLSINSAESITPKKINDSSAEGEDNSPKANGITYSVTPNKSLNTRKYPKRKISVFHRSFDIDTLHASGAAGGPDTYRLTERSMSTPNAKQEKNEDDKMELDFDCMKKSSTCNFLLTNYRGNGNCDSDSSESPSPQKSIGYRGDRSIDPPIITEIPIRPSTRPIVHAPKLKLPLMNNVACFTSVEKKTDKNSDEEKKNVETNVLRENKDFVKSEADLIANDNHKTYNLSKSDEGDVNSGEISTISEMIRPGDEVERGITYRRGSFSREFDFSSYSLLSPVENSTIDNSRDAKLESVSTFVPSIDDGESTSCDSSPKRKPPVDLSSRPLVSTYEKPKGGVQPYVLKDPSKSHELLQVGRFTEIGVVGGYQMRNDSITKNVGSYESRGGGGIIGAPDEKASVLPAVALAMSSGEDSSDSECDPMAIQGDDDRRNVVDETRSISPTVVPFVNGDFLGSSTPAIKSSDSTDEPGDNGLRKPVPQKRDKRERLHTIRRSLSESGCGRTESSCHCTNGASIPPEFNKEETQPSAFPSLTNTRLQESGIANLSSSDEVGGSIPEADLERKYTALSVGLVTDRVTLPRRMALSIRQRDQSERNLACEVQKMHQDIQDLAPLCIDRESLERVERVRHQLEMITQCAHRVSCTAETLGAVHQEHRISRAVLLADRYLLVLRTRCEKLASDLAETKRILTENNIVVEEHNGELGDDLPRIRYCGVSTNNRTMMARRRASIATIFRPLGNFQDLTKDGVRQRNSVSGRVTLRRPSLSAESQKWEAEKLDRTDSSSSIGELREIFEQAESRRNSREENNNVLRLHPSNLSIRDSENGEGDVWACTREEPIPELPSSVNGCQESRTGRRIAQFWTMHTNVSWKPMLWCILISFFLGFYMKHVVSSVNGCSKTPLRWWSIEELLEGYGVVKNDARRPV